MATQHPRATSWSLPAVSLPTGAGYLIAGKGLDTLTTIAALLLKPHRTTELNGFTAGLQAQFGAVVGSLPSFVLVCVGLIAVIETGLFALDRVARASGLWIDVVGRRRDVYLVVGTLFASYALENVTVLTELLL
jgi:hypothetical protein